ncbi:hypothetical protein [Chryseobacterium sp. ISL-6]|uniref:hypothetical protein n=1 Tax=Chryseobacterium sp. ISL-6 TaxID=2819143 RepID=UPI001BE6E643|nr:hypothetical protein [Chryseobacterium sp. ISL-6]MBT2623781.1 hypothetical protein [Chryseobacterium sp. ISL-6]
MTKSKAILGFKTASQFSLDERRVIIEEYLRTGCRKQHIWKKYTGQSLERGKLLRWMRELGYSTKSSKFPVSNSTAMPKPKSGNSLENMQLKEKITELEKALINSELRCTAYETMIEIAEKELKISIKKKSNTKRSIE